VEEGRVDLATWPAPGPTQLHTFQFGDRHKPSRAKKSNTMLEIERQPRRSRVLPLGANPVKVPRSPETLLHKVVRSAETKKKCTSATHSQLVDKSPPLGPFCCEPVRKDDVLSIVSQLCTLIRQNLHSLHNPFESRPSFFCRGSDCASHNPHAIVIFGPRMLLRCILPAMSFTLCIGLILHDAP
jgi:hypothetical protein